MNLKKLFPLSLLALSINTVNAQELYDIYTLAVKNDSLIKSQENSYNAQKEVINQSRARLLPNVSLKADVGSYNTPNSNYNQKGYSINITQPVFNAENWFSFEQSNKISKKALINFTTQQQDLIIRTLDSYINYLRSKETLKTITQQEKSVKRRLEKVQAEHEVGLKTIVDVEDAKSRVDNIYVSKLEAEANLNNSFDDINKLIGQRKEIKENLSDDYPIYSIQPNNVEDWINKAIQNNLRLKIAALDIDIAQYDLKAAKAGNYPKVDLNASYSYEDSTSTRENSYIGLTLSLPLFNGGATSSQKRKAQYNYYSAQDQKHYITSEVKNNVSKLFRNLEIGKRSLEALNQSILSSEKAYEASEAGYNVGTRNIVEVLQAEDSVYQAKLNYLNKKYEYIQNLFNFKKEVGILSPEDIIELDKWINP